MKLTGTERGAGFAGGCLMGKLRVKGLAQIEPCGYGWRLALKGRQALRS